MRCQAALSTIALTILTLLRAEAGASTMAADIATVVAPASKLCLLGKSATLTHGFLTADNVEKTFELLSCFPKDSPQSRAYSLLARLIYSRGYGETIASLRGNNAGLIAYFNERLATDRAFFGRAKAFYEELGQIDQRFYFTEHPELIAKMASLDQASGQGAFAKVSPGWLWSLAMKHAQQDPVAAIELIGICGHDDYHGSPLVNGRGDETFPCPRPGQTLFYTPRSLGDTVDLDPSTKTWIASIQAPTRGLRALPSKTYHVYGGALFSCLMKAQGLPDDEIRATNSLIAKLYRGIDMRNRILISAIHATKPLAQLETELRESCKTRQGQFLCPDFRGPNGYDQSREDGFVAAKLEELDSYRLIERWKMIKKLPVLGLPLEFDLDLTPARASDRPEGWSAERFARAVSRVRTYAVDYAWIEKQHLVGSDFALPRCGR